jgi:hypothetical protein
MASWFYTEEAVEVIGAASIIVSSLEWPRDRIHLGVTLRIDPCKGYILYELTPARPCAVAGLRAYRVKVRPNRNLIQWV